MKRIYAIVLGAGILLTLPLVSTVASEQELPPAAKPGECYARVFVPPVYRTETEQMLKNEGGEKIEIVPARYETGSEIVLLEDVIQNGRVIQSAGTKLSPGDRPMTERLEAVAAKYDWAEEKILIKPSQTVWKKGSGPITRIDGHTGEIMCLVEEPAVYKTVRKRVMTSPASTRPVTVPAKYTTVKVKRMVTPPSERRIEIPAEYQTITKNSLVQDGSVGWKTVLCETNLDRNVISSIQRSLNTSGFNAGTIDGRLGPQTMSAIRAFQRAKGLATGALTMDTLNALNVRIGG